jgi:hypothetical protein
VCGKRGWARLGTAGHGWARLGTAGRGWARLVTARGQSAAAVTVTVTVYSRERRGRTELSRAQKLTSAPAVVRCARKKFSVHFRLARNTRTERSRARKSATGPLPASPPLTRASTGGVH